VHGAAAPARVELQAHERVHEHQVVPARADRPDDGLGPVVGDDHDGVGVLAG
jgi:hypothetical protein